MFGDFVAWAIEGSVWLSAGAFIAWHVPQPVWAKWIQRQVVALYNKVKAKFFS